MSWVVANWRLKLLALVLAIGLLMAVAFSENPVEAKTVPVGIQYVNKPDALVLVQPPPKVNVSVFGLRDAVERVQASAVGVTVDLSGAKVGPNQTFYGRIKVIGTGVTAQSDPVAVLLNIDTYERALLDIEVRLPDSPATGIKITNRVALCPGSKDPCKEPVSGPASILEGLRAFVRYDTPISTAGSSDSPSQPVQFEKNGKVIDLRSINTSPVISIEQPTVAVHIDSAGGTQSKQVVVFAKVINQAPCGYQVNIDVAPSTVSLLGPIEQISKIGSIGLDPINLATLPGSETLTRNINTGFDSVRAEPNTAKVTVTVLQSTACGSPAPSPTPTR